MMSDLLAELTDPTTLLIHIPYALLVISMMMNDMGWLRALAIAAGLIRILNRSLIDIDPAIALWETAFVLVNVVQLSILWYYAKRHRFSDEEKRLLDTMPADIDRRTVRRLLRMASHETVEPGTRLTVAGEPVKRLAFLTDGVAQVERDGSIIAVCGPGDFVGEMSFATRGPASATVVCARPTSFFAFDQDELRHAIAKDSGMRRALDAGFSQNLAGKLARSGVQPAVDG